MDRQLALLHGFHRAACILSTVYRGTPEAPGLVLGLDQGGVCHGVAYGVADEHALSVIDYLYQREMVTLVYKPKFTDVALEDGRQVRALIFIADTQHPQYAGPLTIKEKARMVLQGHGKTGSSREYLSTTVEQLNEIGICDDDLRELLAVVEEE